MFRSTQAPRRGNNETTAWVYGVSVANGSAINSNDVAGITAYPGKLKLIATGFAEAATAVNQAFHWIYPEKKVNPGHSSNMAVFGQKDD